MSCDQKPANTIVEPRMSITESNSRHVKFDDNEEGKMPVKMAPVAKKVDYSSDESDDEDEAPQEEGLSSGKSSIEDEIREREEALKREKQEVKQRRRKLDARFREQQLEKEAKAKDDQELPEELPGEFFEKLDEEVHEKPVEQIPKRINFNDIDTEQYLPEIKKQLEKKRTNTLKRLRATTVKRGLFNVTLLDDSQKLSAMAPKREAKIMNTKDKWLKRKAVKRK